MRPLQSTLFLLSIIGGIIFYPGCKIKETVPAHSVITTHNGSVTAEKASETRHTNPEISEKDISLMVAGNTEFAIDLYKLLAAEKENTFFSPYSISVAFSMAWAGARTQTEKEIAETLHFPFAQGKQHESMKLLNGSLNTSMKSSGFDLSIVNQLWGEKDYVILPDYLKLISVYYNSEARLLDFRNQAEPSRVLINSWVSEQTKQRIKDLIPPGKITDSTKIVLTNAIYCKAEWADTFNAANTSDGKFNCAAGSAVMSKFMAQKAVFYVKKTHEYQAIALPYKGNEKSMLVIMPESGKMKTVEAALKPDFFKEVLHLLKPEYISLQLPKFKFTTKSIGLNSVLASLGLKLSFTGSADFSGIDGRRDLFISDVFHKAFVAMDEKGTEAAAATAIIQSHEVSSERPVPEYTFNRPFIFLIQDNKTGSVLFMGKINDPSIE